MSRFLLFVDKKYVFQWDRRFMTVQSGFMGTSSVASRHLPQRGRLFNGIPKRTINQDGCAKQAFPAGEGGAKRRMRSPCGCSFTSYNKKAEVRRLLLGLILPLIPHAHRQLSFLYLTSSQIPARNRRQFSPSRYRRRSPFYARPARWRAPRPRTLQGS